MPDFRLASETSEAKIKRKHLEAARGRRMRELATSVLRVIPGAGRPEELGGQVAKWVR
jgi:hypothetical protein